MTYKVVSLSAAPTPPKRSRELYREGEKAVRERVYVLGKAEAEPAKYGKFLKEMDAAGNPHGAYKRLREAQRADASPGIAHPIQENLSFVLEMSGSWQNKSDNRNQENRIRRLARQHGYVLRKSRARKHWTVDNQGRFMVLQASRNLVVLGERFDASVEDIELFFSPREAS